MRIARSIVGIFLMVLFQSVITSADAQPRQGAFSVSPFIGGYVFEGNQDIENDFTYGIDLGYHFTDNLAAEAAFNFVETNFDEATDKDLNLFSYHVDMLYHFRTSEKLVPFVALGVGALNYQPEHGKNGTDFTGNYGVGLQYFLNDNIALRCDVRHLLTFDSGEEYNNLLYTAGVSFLFGGHKPTKAAVVQPPPAPRPIPAPAPAPVPAPAPAPIPSVKLNADGGWVCTGLNFDFNKSDIKPAYYSCLNQTVDYLKSKPALKVEVQGHTDKVGTPKYNQKLSEQRANAVMNYLISKGIAKERLCVKGYGFSKPVDTNSTEEGRAKNRRVQFNPISK
jgi:OmpA-OmpF porin, OOP family